MNTMFQWSEAIDILVKLAPAASILGAIFAAKLQFRNSRMLNQETIAKNHYREMLATFLDNTDILYLGASQTSFDALKADPAKFRRYRMLATIMGFAMQELYLAIDLKSEENWQQMIRNFVSLFRYYVLSEADFPDYVKRTLNPQFRKFMEDTAANYQHPTAAMEVSKYLQDARASS